MYFKMHFIKEHIDNSWKSKKHLCFKMQNTSNYVIELFNLEYYHCINYKYFI